MVSLAFSPLRTALHYFQVSVSLLGYKLSGETTLRSSLLPQHVLQPRKQFQKSEKAPKTETYAWLDIILV